VGSSIFGQLWKNQYNALEDWYAKPLVFTPSATGNELIFIVSNMNTIRTLDALTGKLLNSRTVQPPFLQSDIGCGDMPNFIGVAGTPIIDPETETVYFFSKGCKEYLSHRTPPRIRLLSRLNQKLKIMFSLLSVHSTERD